MTVAAIYCRKSTEERGKTDENKSVRRQEQFAREFAAKQGWTVGPVFVDDGISGAEFERRPGLQSMLAAVERGEFRVLIASEVKSIGREQFETGYVLKRLDEAGIEVWCYMEGGRIDIDDAVQKMMFSVKVFGAEAHREDTAKRVYESHEKKHREGRVVGGRTFGYDNVDVFADGTRSPQIRDEKGRAHRHPSASHVERVIDPAEAQVVVRMFELYASGRGLKAVAHALNAEGAPSPKPFLRKDAFGLAPAGAWCPSTVRHALRNEMYRGVYVWNKSKKRNDDGKVQQRDRPESEWQRTSVPEWRIVSDDLWNRVAERRAEGEKTALRFSNGRLVGRPTRQEITNLLADLAKCGVCGGGLVVETYKTSAGKPRGSHYVCARRRASGKKVCSNELRIGLEEMNEAVLAAVEEHALTPEAVEHVLLLAESATEEDRRGGLEREAKALDKKITNLVAAIEQGVDTAGVGARLRELEARKAKIAEELADLRPLPRLPKRMVENRLAEWRRLLRASVAQGRMVLDKVLAGRIVFSPAGYGYQFEAPTRYDRLFAGLVIQNEAWTVNADTGFRPEDIFGNGENDADYARVLERAHRKLANIVGTNVTEVASPPGFEPGFQP